MSSVSQTPTITATILYRLAQACQVHLHNDTLAARLRTLATQKEPRVSEYTPLSMDQAAALASAFDKYLAFADDPASAPQHHDVLAPLRETAQQLQDAFARTARAAHARHVAGLYVIIDPELTCGRDVVEVAGAALRGGATAIQLRDKGHDKGDQLPVARRLMALCQYYGAAFIVNDHADLAIASGAHGLHLGQHDLPVAQARSILHPWQFLGTSNASVQEAEGSAAQNVDYIAVGAIYSTGSKSNTRPAGIETLEHIRERVPTIPIVAIGGITLENIDPVLEAGANGVCVISTICQADDPEEEARRLTQRIAVARI